MLRLSARIVCFGAALGAGFYVYSTMKGMFDGYILWGASGGVFIAVFALLYFPLFLPVSEMISDRLVVAAHRGRHIRSGSGVDELPEGRVPIRCAICGNDQGPVCPACLAKTDGARPPRL